MVAVTLPLGSYKMPMPAASSRRLVNAYAEQPPPDNPRGQPVWLKRAPGIAAWADTEETECRGAIVMGGVPYVVAGSSVYSASSNGTLTAMTGDAVTGTGPVKLATNGTMFVICPGNGDGFSCDGSTVSEITDATFTDGGGADPVFVDGYLVFRRPGTARFFNTGLNVLTFNALDVATAEGAPDDLVSLIANHRELILAGSDSVERWYNAGNSPGSPFSRSPSGFHELGCAAGNSLANQDHTAFMLANDRTVRRLADNWQRVSQHAIESIIQRMAQISDCIALPYRQEGHHFVAFTFRNAGRTLVLDVNTGEWHERESRIDTVSLGYWRPAFIVEAYGRQIVGDTQSGKLGILDPDTHEEWGEPQVVEAVFQPAYGEGRNILHREFRLGVTPGQGTPTGQGYDPQVTLFRSNDGGNTFQSLGLRPLGKMGEYAKRHCRWGGLGTSDKRVYKVQFSDPVPMMLLDAQVEVEGART